MKQRTITQEHGTGCGVACVAYVLAISYDQALELFEQKQNAWGRGYLCVDLVRALAAGGRRYVYRYVKGQEHDRLHQAGAIVYVQGSAQYPLGHYLARTADGRWMNPWSNFPRIAPARSALETDLPGRPLYVIFPEDRPTADAT